MSPLPLIRPMLATAGPIPEKDDGRFAVEMKWDGVRAVSYWDDGQLRLLSRNDNDVTAGYPELAELGSLLGAHNAIVDGEIVAYDRGRPSFEALQARMHVRGAKVKQLAADVPVTLLLFDIMQLDGKATTGLTYTQRRSLLESLELAGTHVLSPPAFHEAPRTVLAASRAQGLEGVVAKAVDSIYLPG
ncbi:MAG TPA: RNA ligase family protein, partial [Acidothermaceae bacterium]|nr:RNA ligase family protein [Acidothermaceae bacterium]